MQGALRQTAASAAEAMPETTVHVAMPESTLRAREAREEALWRSLQGVQFNETPGTSAAGGSECGNTGREMESGR